MQYEKYTFLKKLLQHFSEIQKYYFLHFSFNN